MAIKINNKFNIKDIVYLVTDPDQRKWIITYITIHDNNSFLYGVSCGVETTDCYEFELSADKDLLYN